MPKIQISPVAFNENIKLKSVIERFLKSGMRARADLVIIDDGSTDDTTAVIASYREFGVRTVKHPQRRGVGAAIRTAIRHAQQNNCEVLVIMAGNDKDSPDEITLLVEPILNDGFDLVQGSRYLGHDRTGGDMPFYRRLATRLHPWLMTAITGKLITDSTNGFRAMRLALFQDARINLDQEWLNAYELEPYILFKAFTLGYKVREVPVTKIYPPRKLGYTKMKPIVGWWSILKPLFYLGLGIRK